MAHSSARFKVAPKAATTTFLTRAKAFLTRTKAFLTHAKARVATRVASFVARVKPIARTKAFLTRAKARVATFVVRVKPIAKRAWTVALRPFLGSVLAGTALGGLVISTVIAPATTALTLVVAGGTFILTAKAVKQLEETESDSRFSRVTLAILEGVAQVLRALAYAGAALLVAMLCSVSLPFTAFTVLALTLAYYDVRGSGTIAFLAWCVLSGSWGLGLLWLMWRSSRMAFRTPTAAPVDVPEYSEIRRRPPHVAVGTEEVADAELVEHAHVAVGTEEVADAELVEHAHVAVGTEEVADAELAELVEHEACEACGSTGGMRIRSNAVPFVTAPGGGFGKPHEPSDALLCSACYDAECEDNALALTGVSLRKRSVNVVLNALGRASLAACVSSKADTSQAFWAVTAWWRDRRGHHHDRQWDCFFDGNSVAAVLYDHARKVYRASAYGKFLGTKTSLAAAQRLAVDVFNDGLHKGYGAPDPRPLSPEHAVQLGLIAGGAH